MAEVTNVLAALREIDAALRTGRVLPLTPPLIMELNQILINGTEHETHAVTWPIPATSSAAYTSRRNGATCPTSWIACVVGFMSLFTLMCPRVMTVTLPMLSSRR